MLTFLGVILLIVGGLGLFVKRTYTKAMKRLNELRQNEPARESYDHMGWEDEVRTLEKITGKLSWIGTSKIPLAFTSLAIFIIILPYLFFWAEAGYTYYLVYPTGHEQMVKGQGVKPRLFAKIKPWPNYIDIVAPLPDEEVVEGEIEGLMKPRTIRFIDQVTALMYTAQRVSIPLDEQDFIKFAKQFRSVENLVHNTLIPEIKAQCENTGFMFAAQNFISGEAQAFKQTYEENLTGGSYVVEKRVVPDTTWVTNIEQKGVQRQIKDIQTRFEVEKVIDPETGLPERAPHEITKNRLTVPQVIVTAVVLDTAYQNRLLKQKDESAKRQLEQQEIETAKISLQKELAQGEVTKAKERIAQEKEQIAKLILKETRLKEESTNRDLAELKLKTARLDAQAKKVAADAQYYENQKLVQAGLTPLDEANIEKEKTIGVAAELAKTKWPTWMQIGNGDGEGENRSPVEALLGVAAAQHLGIIPKEKK